MSGHGGRGARKSAEHEEEEHENEERWLVSFADMMTLMFALFMVLFSISSVNTSKFESLKASLENSFDAGVTGGGKKLMETGGSQTDERSSPRPPLPSMLPAASVKAALERPTETINKPTNAAAGGGTSAKSAAQVEQEQFKKLKVKLDKEAKQLGLSSKVTTQVRPRGLVIRLLTDGVLFESGQAVLKPGANGLLEPIGKLIRIERNHPVVVEGYTDNQPIRSSQFPTNWELSGARASRVVRHFISDGVPLRRLSAMQYAQQHPLASNDTEQGRSKNRRVEVVLTRLNQTSTQGGETP